MIATEPLGANSVLKRTGNAFSKACIATKPFQETRDAGFYSFIYLFIYFFRWTSDTIWLTFRVETSSANIRAKGGRKLEVLLGNTEVQVFIQKAVCNPQGA